MSPDTKISALIMAAARGPDDPMARAFNAPHKCLVKIDGTPMLVRVVQALDAARDIGSIGISIDDFKVLGYVSGLGQIELFKSAGSAPDSVIKAIEHMEHPFPLLVTTADHALLTPEIIEYFCQNARNTKGDIIIGLASRAEIERVDRSTRRTYFKFRDGSFSGCNLYYLKSEKALNAVRFWHQIDKRRKQPLALARTFGLLTLVKYMLGILTLSHGLEYASNLLDVRANVVILPFGEAAIDVDKPEDHELVTKLLQKRRWNLDLTE